MLRRAWALVFASPKEGWGITNLEAAACGTPVVASNSPGIRESVRDGETGFLVPHGDVGAMASAMRRIAGDAALVAQLGVQARRFAETFTWERAASETASHLYRVLAHVGPSNDRMHMPAMKVGEILEQVRDLLELERVGGTQRARTRRRGRGHLEPGARAGGLRRALRRQAAAGVRRDRGDLPLLARRDHASRPPGPVLLLSRSPASSSQRARAAGRRRRGGDEGRCRHPAVRAQDERVLQPDQALARRRLRAADHDSTARSPTCTASACCSPARAASASRNACSTSSSAGIASSPTIS